MPEADAATASADAERCQRIASLLRSLADEIEVAGTGRQRRPVDAASGGSYDYPRPRDDPVGSYLPADVEGGER